MKVTCTCNSPCISSCKVCSAPCSRFPHALVCGHVWHATCGDGPPCRRSLPCRYVQSGRTCMRGRLCLFDHRPAAIAGAHATEADLDDVATSERKRADLHCHACGDIVTRKTAHFVVGCKSLKKHPQFVHGRGMASFPCVVDSSDADDSKSHEGPVPALPATATSGHGIARVSLASMFGHGGAAAAVPASSARREATRRLNNALRAEAFAAAEDGVERLAALGIACTRATAPLYSVVSRWDRAGGCPYIFELAVAVADTVCDVMEDAEYGPPTTKIPDYTTEGSRKGVEISRGAGTSRYLEVVVIKNNEGGMEKAVPGEPDLCKVLTGVSYPGSIPAGTTALFHGTNLTSANDIVDVSEGHQGVKIHQAASSHDFGVAFYTTPNYEFALVAAHDQAYVRTGVERDAANTDTIPAVVAFFVPTKPLDDLRAPPSVRVEDCTNWQKVVLHYKAGVGKAVDVNTALWGDDSSNDIEKAGLIEGAVVENCESVDRYGKRPCEDNRPRPRVNADGDVIMQNAFKYPDGVRVLNEVKSAGLVKLEVVTDWSSGQ